MDLKWCGFCKKDLARTEFWKNRSKRDGLQNECKTCSASREKILICTNCQDTFIILHRNVRARKSTLCKPCTSVVTKQQTAVRNVARGRPTINTTKGYEYTRDLSKKHGYTLSHRKVMAENIGRELSVEEVVHHIDGDKSNNKLDNLFLTDQAGHGRLHHSLDLISYKLIQSGVIYFNTLTNEYELR